MKFDLTVPCKTCPFRRGTMVQLRPRRVTEITRGMLHRQGVTFQCHSTIQYDKLSEDTGEQTRMIQARNQPGAQHCAGALIFALKHGTLPQLARIACNLGMLNPDKIMEEAKVTDLVYDTVEEMHEDHEADRKAKV